MKLQDLIKKLGYGVGIHFNHYTNTFSVYKIGEYHPSNGVMNDKDARVCSGADLEEQVVKYIEKFL